MSPAIRRRRELRATGHTYREIARLEGVSHQAIIDSLRSREARRQRMHAHRDRKNPQRRRYRCSGCHRVGHYITSCPEAPCA